MPTTNTRGVGLLAVLLFVAFAAVQGKELRHGDHVRLPDNDAAAEAAEIGINCPSIRDTFRDSSSVKCDGCHVIAVALTYRIARARMTFDEATDGLCDDMMESVLRQKTNGRRFWVPPHKSRSKDQEIKDADREFETSRTITLTGMEARFGSPPTYHDEFEQTVLPCAPYLLKRLCFARFEQHEDDVERCWTSARQNATKAAKLGEVKSGKKGQGVVVVVSPDSDEEESLLNCFSNALGCHTGDCHERRVLKAREAERLRFLKFEGAYGNQKVPFVEDEFTPGHMERNPYAPGGAKANANELLRRRKPSDDL